MEISVQSFREQTFRVAKGSTHPEYSFFTFSGEEKDFRERRWDVAPGDAVMDVGASYGAYTLAALAAGASLVLAFEPESTVHYDLAVNLALNGWLGRGIAIDAGLWSAPGDRDMASYAPHWPRHTISGVYKMTTLDAVAEEHRLDRLDWIKIDVEGAEVHVLAGGLATIARLRPRIIVECHDFLDAGIKDRARHLLTGVGYEFEEEPRPPCTMLIARPR